MTDPRSAGTSGRDGGAVYVAVDVGTGSAKAVAVDLSGQVVAVGRRSYPSTAPRPGWAEQNPRDWTAKAVDALGEVISSLPKATAVTGIALTGQTPTIAPVDQRGAPIGPGLLYRDNRASAEARLISERFGDSEMHRRTGQVPAAFHIAPKLLWLRAHDPDVFSRAALFLQPRDLVLHELTGVFGTDETHANSTLLYDLRARAWSPDLFAALDLDPALLPPVLPSAARAGLLRRDLAEKLGLREGCPVVIGGADSQCAAYGSGVTSPGPVSEMAGTSSCVNSALVQPIEDSRIPQYGHVVPSRFTTELGINTTGAAVSWAVSRLGFDGYRALAAAADPVHLRLRSAGVADAVESAPLFLPFLADGDRGDPTLRAGFLGVSDRHGREELAYAVLEGIAFTVALTTATLAEAGQPVDELRVAGGGAALDLLGAIKSDTIGVPVRHLASDTALVGAALLAASEDGHSEEAGAAVTTGVQTSRSFVPDEVGSDRLRTRFQWFRSAVESPAVRPPAPAAE